MAGKWTRGGGSHAEENALAFVQSVAGEEAPQQNHVQKRRKKQRGLEITFDPQAHKEFVTGFHKRKLQRKKDGQKILEEKAKKARLEDRAQKRAELRARLDLARYETDSDAEAANEDEGKKEVQAYTSNGMQATVTVVPFSLNSDSEGDAGKADDSGSDEEEGQQPRKSAPQKSTAAQVPAAEQRPGKQKRAGTFSRYAGGAQVGEHKKSSGAAAGSSQRGSHKKRRRKR